MKTLIPPKPMRISRRAVRTVCLIAALASTPLWNTATAGSGIDMVPISYVFEGLDAANNIVVTAYTLAPDSDMVRRLQDAAHHGARVTVGLDADAFGQARATNDEVAAQLELSSIEVHEIPTSHMKIALVDGSMYLSDRNWPASSDEQVIIRDTLPGDRRIISDALFSGRCRSNDHLWTKKADALKAEASLIMSRTSDEVDIVSETFGAGTPVFDALLARKNDGDTVKVLFSASDYSRSSVARHAVADLLSRRIEVRLGSTNEKYAIEGYGVWFGSANATRDLPNQTDFGFALRDVGLATRLHSQFESEWRAGSPAPTPHPAQP